jgi:hypothetical protein
VSEQAWAQVLVLELAQELVEGSASVLELVWEQGLAQVLEQVLEQVLAGDTA